METSDYGFESQNHNPKTVYQTATKGLIASFENTTYIIETPNLEGYILILFLRKKKLLLLLLSLF